LFFPSTLGLLSWLVTHLPLSLVGGSPLVWETEVSNVLARDIPPRRGKRESKKVSSHYPSSAVVRDLSPGRFSD